ncbi:hypothetical protein [Haloarcula amylovorans]|uniref:hypothetical protein n=1 Tax=Haloarcula amylovorans TaxID=2562280 RepID=UPI001076BC71|nr:hypothetical protein [Halomicroarcula amylolytica]
MADDRDKLTVPDDLRAKVLDYFGNAATTDSGAMVTALWYACERYEAEHGIDPDAARDSIDTEE